MWCSLHRAGVRPYPASPQRTKWLKDHPVHNSTADCGTWWRPLGMRPETHQRHLVLNNTSQQSNQRVLKEAPTPTLSLGAVRGTTPYQIPPRDADSTLAFSGTRFWAYRLAGVATIGRTAKAAATPSQLLPPSPLGSWTQRAATATTVPPRGKKTRQQCPPRR